MINHTLINAALKARALSLVVATTGSTTLAGTTTGYSRASGSFLTDNFVVGQEVTPSFGVQTPAFITAVSALTMSVNGGRTVQSAGAGRSLRVLLPAMRAFDNQTITPLEGRWFVEGEYSPSTAALSTITASRGYGEATGEYYWRLYGIAAVGDIPFHTMATALLACYPPGDGQALADGSVLRIGDNPAPCVRGNVTPDQAGFSVLTVVVPWRCSFTNPVL
jgi:hypothetical protein